MKAGGTLPFGLWREVEEIVKRSGMTALQVMYPAKRGPECNPSNYDAWKNSGVDLYVHSPFYINPCDPDPKRQRQNRGMFRAVQVFANSIGAKGVVLHPGSRKEDSEETAFQTLTEFLADVTEGVGVVLLETDPGSKAGTRVGSLEFLLRVCDRMNTPNVKLCIDTEHMFARGVDMITDLEVRLTTLAKAQRHLELIHLNVPDEKVKLGSFLDRHSRSISYLADWRGLITACLMSAPVIVERNQTAVQEQEMKLIHAAAGGYVSQVEELITEAWGSVNV